MLSSLSESRGIRVSQKNLNKENQGKTDRKGTKFSFKDDVIMQKLSSVTMGKC